MRIIIALLRKEFLQIFRDSGMLRLIFAVPIVQLIVLVYAADFEIKNLSISFVDKDHSTISRDLISTIYATDYFKIKQQTTSYDDALTYLAKDEVDIIVEIPPNFERDIYREQQPSLMITINALNSMKASIASSYIGAIFKNMSRKAMSNFGSHKSFASSQFEIVYSKWYNPNMNYKSYIIPGILGALITIMCILLTALNIVKETEKGTIEQINVTPMTKLQFFIGKMLPFGIIGLFQLSLGLLVGILVFNLQVVGSFALIYGLAILYIIGVLGLGFFISTISETQSQAMLIYMFFMFILTIMGGFFTPVESMPDWAQTINKINPTAYLIKGIRMIILKGSGLADILPLVYPIVGFSIVSNTMAVFSYRKRA